MVHGTAAFDIEKEDEVRGIRLVHSGVRGATNQDRRRPLFLVEQREARVSNSRKSGRMRRWANLVLPRGLTF